MRKIQDCVSEYISFITGVVAAAAFAPVFQMAGHH
jgi:hypothetical protein